MDIYESLFGKGKQDNRNKKKSASEEDAEPLIINVHDSDSEMNWAIEKARLTFHYFEECLPSPKPDQQYFSVKVKIKDGEMVEHIWLSSCSFDDEGNLFGKIDNVPANVQNIRARRKIGIARSQISDWMIIENGRLIGGYTIRALRDKLSGDALLEFDKEVGVFVDYGVDYFLPNDETPEGVILLLEQAYTDQDLDKILDCKDFFKEAELILDQREIALEPELVDKTAARLKDSFFKSIEEKGMPNFRGLKRAFPKREILGENHILVTVIHQFPNGQLSKQKMHTFKTDYGWKVLFEE